MTVFIGDVHGKYKRYKSIIKKFPGTIQVGDMGVGFRRPHAYGWNNEYYPNPPHQRMVDGGHRFIRGNHDNPNVCKKHSQWIEDGTIEDNRMFIGGALSIDQHLRTEFYTWWRDEELSYGELLSLYDKYIQNKPRVMVTHECPEHVAMMMLHRQYKLEYPSRTRNAFQHMWEEYQPEIWVYGHWHISFDQVLNGTRFVCLNELEYKEIE